MDSRSLVIVRNRHLTVQGKDVRKNEEEEWLWDALRLQKVASDMGEGESALKISPASWGRAARGKAGGSFEVSVALSTGDDVHDGVAAPCAKV
jgi:hypothetical protein